MKIVLLGSGELGKEFTIAAQRLGQTVIAVDNYENAPAMQVAHGFEVINMLDGAELDRIIAKKREIAANQAQVQTAQTNQGNLTGDQQRFRQNIDSLRNVAGQEALVQQYARQLSTSEAQLTALRDQQTQLPRAATTLQTELNTLIENADF